MSVTYLEEQGRFYVRKRGVYNLYDAFHRPYDSVEGEIVKLMEGDGALYAMLRTDSCVRPARLA